MTMIIYCASDRCFHFRSKRVMDLIIQEGGIIMRMSCMASLIISIVLSIILTILLNLLFF
ncbi:hypothetical protein DHX103_12225 [Planococcus sp. X10-3]|uniref:hypothetical protein n=1 Tax=Planococcus sp. X10-3 TaxID=3061240 RepID=UPI003BB1FAC3